MTYSNRERRYSSNAMRVVPNPTTGNSELKHVARCERLTLMAFKVKMFPADHRRATRRKYRRSQCRILDLDQAQCFRMASRTRHHGRGNFQKSCQVEGAMAGFSFGTGCAATGDRDHCRCQQRQMMGPITGLAGGDNHRVNSERQAPADGSYPIIWCARTSLPVGGSTATEIISAQRDRVNGQREKSV